MRLAAASALVALLASCAPDAPPAVAVKKDACCQDAPAPQQVVAKEFLKPAGSRTFKVEYSARISEVPAGAKKLRVWVPVPSSSTVQEIQNLSFSREPRIGTESKYGNRIAYWEIDKPAAAEELTMKFECTRLEIVTNLEALKIEGADAAGDFDVFRKPDALVLVDDEIRAMAAEIVKGRKGTLDKARAIYDHVVARMSYDKSHQGWGLGSTKHACQVGKGNCTDFHALFNSLCRAAGIASGFEIGLYLPYEKGKIEPPGGYHCWAFFRVPGRTWVPVDCSEAMRLSERREFFFGGHTANRVGMSTGRDLVLEPKQDGAPLNYFLNPYAEADGKPVKAEKTWTYQDLD